MGSFDAQPDDTGVYYSREDLAGFFRRLLVLVIDLAIVFVMWVIVLLLSVPLGVSSPFPATAIAFVLAWAYLAGLKAGPKGTLGYRLAGVRLVNLQGRPPSLFISTYRFLLLFVGPLHLVFDLLWLTTDPNRQTLRDKLTATYVVRRDAQPLARAPFVHPTYFIATMAFALPEVKRPLS
jgi:uncharacterized RDD family membrane protein YckC